MIRKRKGKRMGRNPNIFCYSCGSNKFMVYDKVNSKKNSSSGDTKVWWCMNKKDDTLLIVIREFKVNDAVTSVKQYVFENRDPK